MKVKYTPEQESQISELEIKIISINTKISDLRVEYDNVRDTINGINKLGRRQYLDTLKGKCFYIVESYACIPVDKYVRVEVVEYDGDEVLTLLTVKKGSIFRERNKFARSFEESATLERNEFEKAKEITPSEFETHLNTVRNSLI